MVENAVGRGAFVPNDCTIDADSDQIILLTGPNMAGKSTYMRQNELIVILAGGCTLLGGGPSLTAGDSMVLVAGHEYGFTADDDGMTFMTIRTGESSTNVSPGGRA